MIQAEFVKNLNCNYERILLEEKPEENRYQYCIVTRGGVKGILPCSLRYINGTAYLYYDISSTQNVTQLFEGKNINRQWLKDFLWGMQRIRREMDRFLLDDQNLLWYPNQIFQDLEKKDFYFLYLPYYEGDNGFSQLLDYLVEHIDYEDEALVECVYKMHESYSRLGEPYLGEKIFDDAKKIENNAVTKSAVGTDDTATTLARTDAVRATTVVHEDSEKHSEKKLDFENDEKDNRKGIRYFFEGKLKKPKNDRETIYRTTGQMMAGTAVCEDVVYRHSAYSTIDPQTKFDVNKNHVAFGIKPTDVEEENADDEIQESEEIGRTVYMEVRNEEQDRTLGLYTPDGKLITKLNRQSTILGKKKDEADCVLEDISISRMHARITMQKDGIFLEDLNSTNGTSKNGLRLQPYEKRKMEVGDEVKLGKVVMFLK